MKFGSNSIKDTCIDHNAHLNNICLDKACNYVAICSKCKSLHHKAHTTQKISTFLQFNDKKFDQIILQSQDIHLMKLKYYNINKFIQRTISINYDQLIQKITDLLLKEKQTKLNLFNQISLNIGKVFEEYVADWKNNYSEKVSKLSELLKKYDELLIGGTLAGISTVIKPMRSKESEIIKGTRINITDLKEKLEKLLKKDVKKCFKEASIFTFLDNIKQLIIDENENFQTVIENYLYSQSIRVKLNPEINVILYIYIYI